MEVDGQLHGLASSSPKKDASSALPLRGGMNPEPVCALREEKVCQSCQESSLDSSTFHPLAYSLHRLRC